MGTRFHARALTAAAALLCGIAAAKAQAQVPTPAAPDTAASARDEQPGSAEQTHPIAAWSRSAALDETAGSPAERGRAVFNNWCGACHDRGTRNAPGTTSLEHKYRGEVPAALEDRADLTPELVELFVRNGVATMPFFRKTEISDADLDALSAYLARR
jgi:mono/diheme cytochrome c family protein